MGLTGVVETKAPFLAEVKSGERSYESIDDGETGVDIYGDAVVLTGRSTSKGYFKERKSSRRDGPCGDNGLGSIRKGTQGSGQNCKTSIRRFESARRLLR